MTNRLRGARSAAAFVVALVLVCLLFGALGLLGARLATLNHVQRQEPAALRPAAPGNASYNAPAALAATRLATTPNDLYGLVMITESVAVTTEFLARIDPATGEATPIGPGYPNCCNTRALDTAYDPETGRWFAVMARFDETDPRVLTFDAGTGGVTASPAISTLANINYVVYDTAQDQLLALVYEQATGRERLAQLNPTSGELTFVGDQIAPNCCSVGTFMDTAIDPATSRLFVMMRPTDSFTPTLYTVSTITGSAVLTAELQPFIYELNYMAFDPLTPTLRATVFDRVNSEVVFAAIDPTTGQVTPQGSGIDACCSLAATDAALDPNGRRFSVPLTDYPANRDEETRLYSFNLGDGAVAAQPVVRGYTIHGLAYRTGAPESSKSYLYFPWLQKNP